MKNKLNLLSIILLCLFLGNCASSGMRKIAYDKILFGKGGGFTGKYDDYFLSKDGIIYKKDPLTKSYNKMMDLSKKETISIFKIIDANKLFEVGFNNPYNISCYLEIVKGSVSNRIVWGNVKNPPPPEVLAMYDKLMSLVNSVNSKANTMNNKKK